MKRQRHRCDPPAGGAAPRCARGRSISCQSGVVWRRTALCPSVTSLDFKFMTYPSLIQNLTAHISIFFKASSCIFYFPLHLKMATCRSVFLSRCDEVSADTSWGACPLSSPQRPLSQDSLPHSACLTSQRPRRRQAARHLCHLHSAPFLLALCRVSRHLGRLSIHVTTTAVGEAPRIKQEFASPKRSE